MRPFWIFYYFLNEAPPSRASRCLSCHDAKPPSKAPKRKAALERTAKTRASGRLAATFLACEKGSTSPNQQVAVFCVGHRNKGGKPADAIVTIKT